MPRYHRPGRVGAWASPEAERRFRAIEDEVRTELWGDALADVVVETRHGSTHLYHRAGSGTPVVLVPGMGAPALMWLPDLVAGIGTRPVYLLDTIGDVGRSVQTAPIDDPGAVATWLDDVLAGLGVDSVDLVGTSYGGWVALNQALRSPARLRTLALVEPAGLVDINMVKFMAWGLACALASLTPDPVRSRAAVRLRQGALTDGRARRLGALAYRKHQFHLPRPRTLPDDDLRAITTPALVLLGEKSPVYRSATALDRARSFMADVDVHVVAGAGHSLPVEQAELVGRRLGTFLEQADAGHMAGP